MEEIFLSPSVVEGGITNIQFTASTVEEIHTSSVSGFSISHPGQLSNGYLGLPVESGRCDSCGTSEHGKCEGHFGYIQLPIPIYTPQHIGEVRRILSLICFKCLRLTKRISPHQDKHTMISSCSYCEGVPRFMIKEEKTPDGVVYLELSIPNKSKFHDNSWKFMDRYGYSFPGYSASRPLLPYEALQILKNIPDETRKRLSAKSYYPQSGLIMQCLPVPPNCLSVPNIFDGVAKMSADLSASMLRKVLQKIETIKRSRSGSPNFESHEIEANELQLVVAKYMDLRGTTQVPQDKKGFLARKEATNACSKIWLEKIRDLFIRKASSFSSRSVITGDAFRGINEIGLPKEIADRITFEEKVTTHNIGWLQKMVDERRCVMYKDGFSSYAMRVGSKGDKFLKIGQVVQRPIVDGDIVFVNRPPSTHKHSLQALLAYIHEDHVVKINPLICAPFGADFDGDCVHIYYPQSLSAKSEALELFSVENQLFSSHTGALNLQFVNDSLLSLKLFFKSFFLNKAAAQQLVMSAFPAFPDPAVLKSSHGKPQWTVLQILQAALPADFDCSVDKQLIRFGEILNLDCKRDSLQSLFAEVVTSVVKIKGPSEAVQFLNFLQPLLMEMLFSHGFSVDLEDFLVPNDIIRDMKRNVDYASRGFRHMGLNYNECVESQLGTDLRNISNQIVPFVLSTSLGKLIDLKSKSSLGKVAEQLAFLGLQLYGKGRFYSRKLIGNIISSFQRKYMPDMIPPEAFGIVKSSFFEGLNPYEELVHVITARESAIRSTRGLTEPGILFKKLMAVLRDVVLCYDGTVRNICSNSVILFRYEVASPSSPCAMAPAGEPVGVLAATAVSNPSYKAVLDSSQSNTNSWQLMKEVLLCKTKFVGSEKQNDKRVILFLNDCPCGKMYCRENGAYTIQNHLRRVALKDLASEFIIEYQKQANPEENTGTNAGLVGHIHLNEKKLMELQCGLEDIHEFCQELVNDNSKGRKKFAQLFKRVHILSSGSCSLLQSDASVPCLRYYYEDETGNRSIKEIQGIMADVICPALLDTVVKGDPRISMVNIIWTDLDSTIWMRNEETMPKGEIALELVMAKDVVKDFSDAWRVALDSCLPVMHLIDTTRSIPYGVKQIQEIYGISFAFEEAVQRLFASISAVSKGVLKEHLILVASCMSCTGNLSGFNDSGYKALLHSLKVQVPFTEATIFTPMKCFGKAAEKCHKDNLSSIVASCAWGKKTTVGTGASFEILWEKNMISNQEINVNAFDILQMIRSTTSRKVGSDCLFDGDYDLLEENENRALVLSPEQDLEFEPTFEDNMESQLNWQSGPATTAKPSEDGWNTSKTNHEQSSDTAAKHNEDGWDSWKTNRKKNSAAKPSEDGWNSWKTNHEQHSDTAAQPNEDGWDSWKTNHEPDSAKPSEDGWNSWKTNHEWSSDTAAKHNEERWDSRKTNHEQDSAAKPSEDEWHSWKTTHEQSSDTAVNHNVDGWDSWKTNHDWDSAAKPSEDGWNSWKANHEPSPGIHAEDNESNEKEFDIWNGRPSNNEESWEKVSKDEPKGWKLQRPGSEINLSPNRGPLKYEESWDTTTEADGSWDHVKAKGAAWNNHATGEFDREAPEGSTSSPRKFVGGWKKSMGPHKNHSVMTPVNMNLTATRRRKDQFSAEEIEVLDDVDPKIKSVKDILQKYSNGERLSADDQSFVLEKVLNYHPNRLEKMGPNFDFVMVDEAGGHRGSRCFYLVSSDGTREDFSYVKCMKSYVEVTYPDRAECFILKYFRTKDPVKQ